MRFKLPWAACLLAPVLVLSGCANPNANRLDHLLQQVNYKSAGQISSMHKRNGVDSSARVVEYSTAGPYAKLRLRLEELGYECSERTLPPAEKSIACRNGDDDVSVGLKLEANRNHTYFYLSIP